MDRRIVEKVLTSPRLIVHTEDVEESRFTRTRRTHDRNKLTRFYVEIDSAQDIGLRRTVRKSLFNVPQVDHEIAPKPLSFNSRFASSISPRLAPASSSTIKPSHKSTMPSASWAYRGSR